MKLTDSFLIPGPGADFLYNIVQLHNLVAYFNNILEHIDV